MVHGTLRVLVMAADGVEGGSVARRLLRIDRSSLQDPPYAVRALVEDRLSPAARRLALAGAEIVCGSPDDPPSLDAALAGSDLVFGVTNRREHGEAGVARGCALVDAVAASGAKRLVLSTQAFPVEPVESTLRVPSWETIAAVERYALAKLQAVTFVHVAFFYENFLNRFRLRPLADGSLVLGLAPGEAPLAAVSAEDVGTLVEAILQQADRYAGETVGIVGDDLPVWLYAAVMGRTLSRKVVALPEEREAHRAANDDVPAASNRFFPDPKDDLATCRSLHPGLRSFAHWMALNHAGFCDADRLAASAWAA